jgi:hypothetical protein
MRERPSADATSDQIEKRKGCSHVRSADRQSTTEGDLVCGHQSNAEAALSPVFNRTPEGRSFALWSPILTAAFAFSLSATDSGDGRCSGVRQP